MAFRRALDTPVIPIDNEDNIEPKPKKDNKKEKEKVLEGVVIQAESSLKKWLTVIVLSIVYIMLLCFIRSFWPSCWEAAWNWKLLFLGAHALIVVAIYLNFAKVIFSDNTKKSINTLFYFLCLAYIVCVVLVLITGREKTRIEIEKENEQLRKGTDQIQAHAQQLQKELGQIKENKKRQENPWITLPDGTLTVRLEPGEWASKTFELMPGDQTPKILVAQDHYRVRVESVGDKGFFYERNGERIYIGQKKNILYSAKEGDLLCRAIADKEECKIIFHIVRLSL